MSNQQNHTEMIDAYLRGELTQEDSSRLMELLEQDPALKDEFLLQQDLVKSLQDHRRSELKARLNKIDVGTGVSYTGAGALKMVAGTALVALLGTGIYFALDQAGQENESINQVDISIQEENSFAYTEIPEKPVAKGPATVTVVEEKVGTAESIKENKGKEVAITKKTAKSVTDKKSSPAVEKAPASPIVRTKENSPTETTEVVKPEVISFFDEQDPSANTPKADTPEDKLNDSRSFITQNIEVSTVTDRRYNFHYMFSENQLHMYGEFSKVPYEVLEVNTGTTTRYFLYHNGLYYELNPDQRSITRLKELKNESMIKELELTRNKKLNR